MTEDEIAQRAEDLDRREGVLRLDRFRFELRGALGAAKCRPDAIDDAIALLSASAAPEFDADGRMTRVKIGEKEYATGASAAEAFMAERQHWAVAPEPPRLVSPTKTASKGKAQEKGDSADPAPYSSPIDLAQRGWLKPPA